MILEASFALSKCGGVIVASPIVDRSGHVVMQHLVKDDGLDEKPRHPGLIENGMHTDEPFLGQIGAELEGSLASLRLHTLAPGDANVERASKMAAGEVVDDGSEVVMTSFRAELAARARVGDETSAIFFDEPVDRAGRSSAAIAEVVGDCRQDVLLRDQKHVMKAHLEASTLGFG